MPISQIQSASLASGVPTASQGSSMVLIGSATANNSATIDFTNISNTTYNAYRIYVTNAIPTTNAVNLLLRGSVNGSWITTAYTWQNWRWTSSGQGVTGQNAAGTGIPLDAAGADNMANSVGGSWVVDIFNTANGGYKVVNYQGYYQGSAPLGIIGNGWIAGGPQIDGFRFLMDSGNIASGTFFLYGIKNA